VADLGEVRPPCSGAASRCWLVCRLVRSSAQDVLSAPEVDVGRHEMVDGDPPHRRSGQRGDLGDEGAPELLGGEDGQDIAEVIAASSAVVSSVAAPQANRGEVLSVCHGLLHPIALMVVTPRMPRGRPGGLNTKLSSA
jgi:hypothetical protein